MDIMKKPANNMTIVIYCVFKRVIFVEFIFDIVNNKRNSIDVDKYDYIRRDSYHLGLKDTYYDYDTLIQ